MISKELTKELFDMVYQWGQVGVVADENSLAFQRKLKELLESKNV